jgi:hypothetical protein
MSKPMTRKEWTAIAAHIDEWWPATDFTEATEEAWFEELQRYTAADVERAVRACLRDPNHAVWAPSLAAIMQKIANAEEVVARVNVPEFGRVLARIQWAFRNAAGTPDVNPEFYSQVNALLWGESQLIGAWAEGYGLETLHHERTGDAEYGGAVRAKLEKNWEGFVARFLEQVRDRGATTALEAGSIARAGQLAHTNARAALEPSEAPS